MSPLRISVHSSCIALIDAKRVFSSNLTHPSKDSSCSAPLRLPQTSGRSCQHEQKLWNLSIPMSPCRNTSRPRHHHADPRLPKIRLPIATVLQGRGSRRLNSIWTRRFHVHPRSSEPIQEALVEELVVGNGVRLKMNMMCQALVRRRGKHPWRPHETTKGCNPTGSCTARVQEDDDIAGSSALLSILLWFPAERVTELNRLWKRMAPEHFLDSFQVQPHTFFDSVTRIMPLVSLVLPRPNFGRRLLIEWGKQEPLPCKPDSQSQVYIVRCSVSSCHMW